MDMNKLKAVVARSVSAIGSLRQAIVNYVSQPKNNPNGGLYTGGSQLPVGEKEIDDVIPKGNKLFNEFEEEAAKKREIPEELFKVEIDQEVRKQKQVSSDKYSINRKLSYSKKKTQQRNWKKWRKGGL